MVFDERFETTKRLVLVDVRQLVGDEALEIQQPSFGVVTKHQAFRHVIVVSKRGLADGLVSQVPKIVGIATLRHAEQASDGAECLELARQLEVLRVLRQTSNEVVT